MWTKLLISLIYKKMLAKKNDTGRKIQVMVEATKIQKYMSNDMPTLVYKGIV